MDELEKLFNVLTRDGYYTKSFEEFQSQYNDPAYRDKVFGAVTRDGLYTNSREEFDVKYSPSGAVVEETITEDPLKKKEDTESVSADGLSESPKTEVVSEQVEVKEDIKPSVFKPKTGFAKQISEDNLFDFSGKGILEKKSPSFNIEEAASRIEMTPEQRREESIEKDLEILFPKGVPEYITQSKIDAEDEEIKRKLNLLDTYNAAIIQQGGEPMSTSEYISTGIYGDVMVDEYGFEKIEDLRSPSKKTIIEQVVKSEILSPDYPLRSEEDISTVKKKITPVSSEKKQEFIDNIISIDKTMLGDYNVNTITGEVINQSEYDFTEVLDEDSYNERKNEIEKNKLNNAFVKNYIPRELYEANKYKSLAPTDFALLNIRAIDNFKNEFGEQEWIEYQNITGNKNPSLVGTKYENESAADSKIQDLVVIGDEDSTVANLSREFPSFDFEVSKAVTAGVEHDKYGDYITISTKDNQGRVVNALEIYLKENNNPVDRIRDFMSGSLLSKKDKSFIDKADNYYKEIDGIVGRSTQSIGQYEKENFGKDPVKELEIYNFLVSNPKKFGDADSPAMYGKDRSIGVIDVDHINFFLDKNKGNISQETIDMIRKKMSMTEGVYSKELAQQGSWASAINTGFAKFIYGFSEGGTGALMSLPSPILSNEEKKEIKNSALEAIEIAKERFTGTTPESMAVRPMSQKAADVFADMIPSIIFGGQVSKGLGLAGKVVGTGKKAKQLLATGSGFAPQTYGAISQELKDVDIPEYQKGLLALPITLVEQMLEGISGIKILNRGNFPIFMNVAIGALKDLPKDASEKTIKAAIRNNLKARLVSLGGEIATNQITEGATEGAQTISEDLFKRIYNEFYSMDVFKVPDLSTKEGMQSYIDAVYESVELGIIAGGIGGGGFRAVGSLQKGFKTKQDNKQFKFLYEDLMNDKDLTKRRVSLRLDLETGNITQKRYNESLDILNNGKGIMSQIPEDLSTNKKRESFILLREKQQIEKKIAGKNKELESENIKRIKEIDFLLNSIGQSRKSKTETDAAPVIEESPIKESPVDAPVAEETTVTEEVTEEAPVTEEERTAMQEALETQPITKITTDLVAKEKKGELTQEETDGVLLGIMEKIEAENAKRKSPLSPEQAQKKLGKMQQRVFEGNKQRYLELSGVMPAAQEQVVEEAPVVEQVTKEVVLRPTDSSNPSFEKGSMQTFTIDGGVLEIGKIKGGKLFQILSLKVDESQRRKGKAESLLKEAIEYTDGQITGMASNDASVSLNYKLGMRAKGDENLSLEETLAKRKEKTEDGSISMIIPSTKQAPKRKTRKKKVTPVVKETPVKEAPKRKTRKKKDVSLQQDEIQDKRRTTRRAKRKSESTRASSTRDVKGKPRYDVRESNRVVRDDTVVNTISLSENEAQDLSDNTKGRAVIDTEFYETNDAKLFHKSITESTKNNKYAASVFVYPVSDYKNSRLFLTADGKAGLAITEDGDIISVFSYGEGKGRIPQLIVTAIKEGAVSLDHYDTVLTKYYAKFGFVPAAKVTWNDEFAPDGWSKETFRDFNNGEPDVVAMVYDGGNRETITERVGTFEDVTPKLEEAPYVTEWDDAKKLQAKKKKPKKQEAKISEEVQKEIKRAAGTRVSIVGPLKTKLDKTRGFEQKEEIRDEIRQVNKRYNNIITELKEGKRTRFRLSDDATVETEGGFITEEAIVEVMKGLGSAEANFKIPVGEKQTQVDPIALSKSLKKITDAQAKKLGFKSVDDMLKNIEEFNGIPMVVAMSDVLAAGTVKDSMGNDMQVDGGLLYNVLGRNKTLAWAGVNETGATVQFEEAKEMYRANKELFDRLWKEGKLPKNHVPMVVLRMGGPAINSNEAVFRFLSPKAKSYPKANQKAAFEALMKSIEAKKNVSQKSKTGKDTVKSAQELESIIKKNKIKDIGSLFDFIVKDAKKRAKGDAKTTIALNTRALLFDMMVSPEGVGKASKPPAKALIKGTDSNGSEFLSDTILSEIAEPSMLQAESGDAVAIMGVDVSKNGGVTKAKHNNYGFGPKGRLIALIRNPMNGLDIFPEWRAKAARIFKKDARGEMPTSEKVSRQTAGAFFGDKAMRGARVQTQPSDIDIIAGKMRFAFPSVSVSQTQQEFDEVLKQEGIRKAEANGNTILGLTKDGKIFLNPSRESLSTPIHEFGHIWIDYLRSESSKEKGTKLLEKGLELVEGTKALESAIKKYGDNALAREEALVELMGTKGETIANAAKKAKFVEWFNAFFKYIKEKLTRFADIKAKDIKDITLEEFVDIGLAELFSGEAVDAKFKPEEAAESAKARMQKANIKPSMSAQNIINKARAAELRDAVIVDYLMSEKDLTSKQAVSAIKRANRGNLKDAVKRLFNNVEDITDIKEKDAQLIKDILKFDRSITRADKMAQKKAKNEIKSRLKAIQRASKGKLSQAQLLAVTNRFANVNLSSEKSIDSFVDYMQKVFSDVDYAAKMTSLNKSIKQAKKNINSRIGRGADGLAYELRRLLNISPTIIPDSVLEEYSDLVTSFGEKKTVLNLKDSAEVKETIAKIFEELSVQNSELGELSERFEAFEDKEFTKTGAVSFAKTVAQMLKDKVITEDEAKLMRKFKSEIMPIEKAEGKTEEEKLQEMEEEKKILLESVKSAKVDIERIELAIEKALVKDFARLIKTDAINDLNNAQLKNIEKAIDNINNGYVAHYVQLASENLVSINRSKTGAEGIRDAKPLAVSTQIAKIKTLYEKGSDANKFYKLIERNPLINIDMVLGDFTSKRIFNSVLEESAEAVTTFNTELNKVYNTIEDAEVLLQKKFKNNGNKILESKYKQMAYMVQQEFESNPNNSQVNPAAEVIESTITKLRDSNQNYEADILQGILENYSTDGQIDLKKLDDSFVYAELNMIKTVQDINSKLTDKATYTASVIRGESIEPLNDYIHQSVLNTDGVAVDDSRALSENYMENIKPSTKAKNLIERTKGAKAINFDITASVRRGAKMTLMDYHLTAPLRTANRTLNKIEKQLDAAGQERQIFLAVRDAYNQAIADILENTFTSSSIGEQVFQYAAKQGYRSMLASVPRVFVELASNYAFALNNPTEFAEGSKPKNMKVAFSDRGVEVMNNVNSKQTARMYGEELSGRFVESSMINKKMGMAADSAKNPVVNRLNQGLSYLKKYPRGVEVVADFMITTPDKLVTRPMWFGSFATEFKKITGQEVDFNKIAENDAEYMEKFEEAINEAKRKADDNTVLIGATDNPLMGILKNKKRASDKGFPTLLIKTINTFMQRFLLFEYNAFRKGMYAAMGRGDISRGRGARLMLAVSARMTIYTTLMPILASLIFGDDDEDEDESIYTRVYRGIVSTMTNLFIGRDFGAIVKMIQNYFIEYANKEYGRDLGLREGKYDPFKNQVQFNIIPPEKSYKETDIASDILPNMLGPYTPLVKSLIFSGNKLFFSKPKKEEDARERQRREKEERIPLELLGLTGLVPFYKDIRKKLNEDIYKGLRKKDSDEEEEEESSGRRKRGSNNKKRRGRRKN